MAVALIGYTGGRGVQYLSTPAEAQKAYRAYVPVVDKCGALYWADDLTVSDGDDVTSWAPRYDQINAGALVSGGTPPSLETTGWGPLPGSVNQPCVRFTSGSSESLVNSGGELVDVLEVVALYEEVATIPSRNTVVSWGSTTTADEEVQFYRSSNNSMVRVNGADVEVDGGNQGQTEQQMAHILRNGTTLSYYERILHESDTVVSASAPNEFRVGAVNIAGSITDYGNVRIRGIWARNPSAEPLTSDERQEIFRWVLGAHAQEPYYADETEWIAVCVYGQSNAIGYATDSSVSGLPDAAVRSWPRAVDGTPVDPTALVDLQIRDGSTDRHGAWAYAQAGAFGSTPHHVMYCGQGGTSINTWNNTATRGVWSSQLDSEALRAPHEFFPRMGGSPIHHIIWIHGETDASFGTGQSTYRNSLKTRISRFRAQHGSDTWVHLVTMCEQITNDITLSNLQAINAAMRNLADPLHADYDPFVKIVDLAPVATPGMMQGDNLHYTSSPGYSTIWSMCQTSIASTL